jgi:hypothetical protein
VQRDHSPVSARFRLEFHHPNEILRFLIELADAARLPQENEIGFSLSINTDEQ